MKVLLPIQIKVSLVPTDKYSTQGYEETKDLLNYKDEFDCIVTYPIDGAKLSLIEHFSKAKEFIILGSGKENIDFEYAKEKGVNIITLKGINESAVVEWLNFHYLLFKRQFDVYGITTRPNSEFSKHLYLRTIPIIKGIGFIGFGKIANRFVKSIELVHTQIYYYDPYVTSDIGVKTDSVNEVFKNCEIIIISVPLTTKTMNLINGSSLKDINHKVSILSISRYEVINWMTLAPLQSKLQFVAVDSLPDEYLMTKRNTKINNNPLFEISKSIPIGVTPHIAGRTIETSLKIASELNGHFAGHWNASNYSKVQDYIHDLSSTELSKLNDKFLEATKDETTPNAIDATRIKLEGIINEQTKLSTYKTKDNGKV